MNIGKIFSFLYKTLLKGKTVKVGGQDITFPQKGHQPNFELLDEKKK